MKCYWSNNKSITDRKWIRACLYKVAEGCVQVKIDLNAESLLFTWQLLRLLWALRDKEQTLEDLYNIKKCTDNSQVCTKKEFDVISLVQTCNDTVI